MTHELEHISMMEILQAINESTTRIQKQLDELKQNTSDLWKGLDDVRQEVRSGFAYHETWFNRIEKNMATKLQFNSLLKVLEKKEVISDYEVNQIIGSESGV